MVEIKEDKFFARLLSKKSSNSSSNMGSSGCPSFRIYYGGISESVAVPFVWEAKPGTPKHTSSHHHLLHDDDHDQKYNSVIIPPLTPPPPISPFIHRNSKKKPSSNNKKVNFLVGFFLGILNRVTCRRQNSSTRAVESWFDYEANEKEVEEEEGGGGGMGSPRSIFCFGFVGHQTKTHRFDP